MVESISSNDPRTYLRAHLALVFARRTIAGHNLVRGQFEWLRQNVVVAARWLPVGGKRNGSGRRVHVPIGRGVSGVDGGVVDAHNAVVVARGLVQPIGCAQYVRGCQNKTN